MVKIFDEYDNITIVGGSCNGRYRALYKLTRLPNAEITYDKLLEYVRNLRQKFPDRDFMLKEARYDGKTFYVITRKSYTKVGDKIKIVRDRVPIYFNIHEQAIYVPRSYLKQQKKLTHYVLMRTLGALKIARVKYVRTL